jgi:hypothetical protein
MSSARLIRWSGIVTIVAGILLVPFSLLHPREVTPPPDPTVVLTSPWALIHTLIMLSAILTLLGLVGLYAYQVEQSGWLGLSGFLLAFLGSAVQVGFWFFDSYVIPLLAVHAPVLLTDKTLLLTGPFAVAYLFGGIGSIIGFMIFGFASARAGVLPRWAGILLVVGAPIFTLSPAGPIQLGGAILFGLGLAWSGYEVWSGTGEIAQYPAPAR